MSMKVLIAMSGGVDSSVAALLEKNRGYECIGCTMKLYANENLGVSAGHTCCSLDDVEDARSVARKLGIPYYVFNFSDLFKEKVVDKFVISYENGLTPNPCIDCNRCMKFDKLYERARLLGCEKVVTGHYARIHKTEDGYELLKAVDEKKDQSYVLYFMTQEQLAHTEFPLGELSKSETRELALKNDFINFNKPDSQDICFVPDGDYVAAIKRFSGKDYPRGHFVDKNGATLGEHKGIIAYTLGQRRGLNISAEQRLYVCKIDSVMNEVVLGAEKDLYRSEIRVREFHWISGNPLNAEFDCKAKLRYQQLEQKVHVTVLDNMEVLLSFENPQRAPTPGQAAVLYQNEVVLGGGIIC